MPNERLRDAILRTIYGARSTLALVPFQDAFGARDRINVPGTVTPANWAYRMPTTVEDLERDQETVERLAALAEATGRSGPAR